MPPSDGVSFIYNLPNPNRGQQYYPNVTQDDWDDVNDETVPNTFVEKEEDHLPQFLQISPRLRINESIAVPAAGIFQVALTAFMSNKHLEELSQMAGRNLDPVDIEQITNRVVDPVTKETITKYKKLIEGPLLRNDWMLGICKNLGRSAQGCGK